MESFTTKKHKLGKIFNESDFYLIFWQISVRYLQPFLIKALTSYT